MQVITAPEQIGFDSLRFKSVFLAGGITNCPEWQDELITHLDNLIGQFDVVVINPRRKNFPIGDKRAGLEQIEWEFEMLKHASVFSMWFSNADSDQPICMYELGRHLSLRKLMSLDLSVDGFVLGVEEGYRRELDVYAQVFHAARPKVPEISVCLKDHAIRIAIALGFPLSKRKLSGKQSSILNTLREHEEEKREKRSSHEIVRYPGHKGTEKADHED